MEDTNTKSLEFFRGTSASGLLESPTFLAAWERLRLTCPHGTCFQSPAYVRAWYRHYRAYQPVVLRQTADGELVGLWLLAFNPATRDLVHAGAHQAEYHVWLASPRFETEFLNAAWEELRRRVPFRTLRFRYLPAMSLVEALRRADRVRPCMSFRVFRKPMLVLDAEEIRASFAKKSNKSRFNRLRKLGPLEFRRIRTAEELRSVFDDIVACYDLRQGAVNRATPFASDPARVPFHFDIFESAPEIVHVTVTLLNNRTIAALWGFVTGKTLHLELLAHSPLVAEHSPGKLHIMQLSDALVNEGAEVLDLTPGGDPWKERFATAHEETADVTLYRNAHAGRLAEAAGRFLEWGKRIAAPWGVRPADVRRTWREVQRASPASAGRRIRDWVSAARESRVYSLERNLAASLALSGRVAKNSLADLLRFEPGRPGMHPEDFFSAALERLEKGESCFTITIEQRLALSAWLVSEGKEWFVASVNQTVPVPAGAVALHGIVRHRPLEGEDSYLTMIRHILRTVSDEGGVERFYISVPSDDRKSRQAIESLGFHYRGSLHLARRWGAERKWADPELAMPAAAARVESAALSP